jgi:hypothetical protein
MKSQKTQIRTFPSPPSAEEIIAARKIVMKMVGDEIMTTMKMEGHAAMHCAFSEGWHLHEVYFGILIGLQIAKARRDGE